MKQTIAFTCMFLFITSPILLAQDESAFPTEQQLTELYRIRQFALAETNAKKDIANTRKQLIAAFESTGADEADLKKALAGLDATLKKVLSKDPKIRDYQLGTAQDLKSSMQLQMHWVNKRDLSSFAKGNRTLLPDAESLTIALKDDVDEATVAGLLKMYQRFSPEDEDDEEGWAELINFRPDQKDIRVFGATTEEIAKQSTAAAKRFPGGAVAAANKILRPETTFYRVEFVVPGEELGVSYHLFYWGETSWKMLGPVWRAGRSGAKPPSEPE